MENEAYLASLRRDIEFEAPLAGRTYRFRTTWGLFSPREIDEGTRLLLDYIEVGEADDCLDLGCGYGPIGMSMAARAPKGQTVLVDKDFVAVDYSNRNLAANGVSNARAILSNGFDQVDPALRFDLVASNIPAKVGKELLTLMLNDAKARMKPGGCIYVVTVNGLRQFIKRYFNEVFGNYDKLKQGAHYTVAVARRED